MLRIPFRHLSPRTQARRPIAQIRRGRQRRAILRMLRCTECDGVGGIVWTLGEREMVVLCGVCGGGRC